MSRPERLAELIKQEVFTILTKEVSDPRIGFITITDVKVSGDLRHANIFVSILGDEKKRQDGIKGLDSATSFIRGELGHRLELRIVPEIIFKLDHSVARAARIEEIIHDLNKEQS